MANSNDEDVLQIVQEWCEATGTGLAHEVLQKYLEECAEREGGTIDWVRASEKLSELSAVNLSLNVYLQDRGLKGEKFSS